MKGSTTAISIIISAMVCAYSLSPFRYTNRIGSHKISGKYSIINDGIQISKNTV